MSELNDHPESAAEMDAIDLDGLEPQSVEPHDAPWPDDTVATGDAAVDSALGRLAGVSAAPVAEHSGLYAEIHDSLLAALDADER
ncbi:MULTISPECIES: hypothetical protein [Arthrobacter]|uniref:hypothetical protein n=1 Tax=Arthrobacter TaxID=1663 RepID=UPI0011163B60|nr:MULTISPECIES: hypothetical protein [Arthrobacter]MDQ0212853.1 hypothetical protein [Arthrobacter bambusae]MDQ0237159.1 hypothetical protein [Arthrobacter bambusae]